MTAGALEKPTCARDSHELCEEWAGGGECERNPDFMLDRCPRSCHVCEPPPAVAGPAHATWVLSDGELVLEARKAEVEWWNQSGFGLFADSSGARQVWCGWCGRGLAGSGARERRQ